MPKAPWAILVGLALLMSSPAQAQSLDGSCFRIETPSMRWDAGDLETTTIQEPPSALFRTVTPQFVALKAGGEIARLDGPEESDLAMGNWRLEGDSLSLEWEREPHRVWGSFEWLGDEGIWLGTLWDGTSDGEKGHWSATTRLGPVRCPSRPLKNQAG